jgi:hypothetical protein
LKGFFGSLTTLAYGAKIFLTGMPISSSAQHARMGDLSYAGVLADPYLVAAFSAA